MLQPFYSRNKKEYKEYLNIYLVCKNWASGHMKFWLLLNSKRFMMISYGHENLTIIKPLNRRSTQVTECK